MNKKSSGLVYSTDCGRICPGCLRPQKECVCRQQHTTLKTNDGVVRVSRETKGRKGKGVTLITGVPLTGAALKDFVKGLKQKCGTGGAIKENMIEIQGDKRDILIPELEKQGWPVKKSGG
jgi:translation initiation factor 1